MGFWEAFDWHARGQVEGPLPPPGCTFQANPRGAWLPQICGPLDDLPKHVKYASLLEQVETALPPGSDLVAKWTNRASKRDLAFVHLIGSWPVVYDSGGTEEENMDWLRVTYRGVLGGVEQFQHKFDFRTTGAGAYPATADGMLSLAGSFRDWWGTALAYNNGVSQGQLLNKLGGDVSYTECGVAHLSQAAAGGQPAYGPLGTTWSAWATGSRPTGAGGVTLPYETACAVTLQSDTRGGRGRGRSYLPPFGTLTLGNFGLFSQATVDAAGRCIDKFYDQVTNDGDFLPVVVSLAGGASHEITTASVGHVPDSQRRRRKSQIEANTLVWPAV